jgi:hypothetical protein
VQDPARERLGRLPQELRRRAPEHEKPRRQGAAVRQRAQDREQIGPSLDLVDDDQAAQESGRASIGESL